MKEYTKTIIEEFYWDVVSEDITVEYTVDMYFIEQTQNSPKERGCEVTIYRAVTYTGDDITDNVLLELLEEHISKGML